MISVSDGTATASLAAFAMTVNPAANDPPTISGTPATTVNAGVAYTFQPNGADPDGDTLTYSVQNRPTLGYVQYQHGPAVRHAHGSAGWRVFEHPHQRERQERQRIPAGVLHHGSAADERQRYGVLDGSDENTDGSTLTDLAGFRIDYGTSAGALNQTVEIANPGLATYVVNGLTSGNWYFAVWAYNSAGAESRCPTSSAKPFRR